jgi:WS/DGAT/MGAT family acyltransferase
MEALLMSTTVGIADRILLLQEATETPQHVAALGTFALPPDAPDDYVRRLVASFRAARTFAPPFNYRLRHPKLRAIAPAIEVLADEAIDLDFHFRHSALPKPGDERELGVLISRLHSRALDLSKPLWEAHLIEGLDGNRFAFYFKVHHAVMDGVGGSRRLQRMLSTDPTDTAVRPLWTIGPSASSTAQADRADRAIAGRLLDAARGTRSAVGTAAGLGRAAGGLLKDAVLPDEEAVATPYKVPGSPLNGAIGQQRRVATQAFEFERVRAVADRAGVTINDVFLAICAGGLRRYLDELDALPSTGLVAGTPISVRGGAGDNANNAFTMAVMKLFTDVRDPLQRITAIHRSSTRTKKSMSGLPKPVAENYGALFMTPFVAQQLVGLGGHFRPPFNLAISNVPGPLDTQYLAGSELEAMYPVGLLFRGTRLLIASLTISGRMCLGFTGDRDHLAHLQRLAVYTGEALDELEAALANRSAPRTERKPATAAVVAARN